MGIRSEEHGGHRAWLSALRTALLGLLTVSAMQALAAGEAAPTPVSPPPAATAAEIERGRTALAAAETQHGRESAQALRELNGFIGLLSRGPAELRHELLPLMERQTLMAENVLGPHSSFLAASLEDLARLHQAHGNLASALPLLQRRSAIVERMSAPDDPGVVQALIDLAAILLKMGREGQAIPMVERIVEIRTRVLGPEHPLVAEHLNDLALLHHRTGQHGAALPLYQRSLAIRTRALGDRHPEVAQSLQNIAGLHKDRGQHAAALNYFQRSLAISESTLGTQHPFVAQVLNNIAHTHYLMGRHSTALAFYNRSLRIYEEHPDDHRRSVALLLNNLAVLHIAMGNYAQAIALYERSVPLFESALWPGHPDVAGAIANLAHAHELVGQPSKGIALAQRSVALFEEALGPRHPRLAVGLNRLAGLHQAMGDFDQALPLYERSLAIREAVFGAHHFLVAASLNNLASLRQEAGQHAQALALYQRSLATLEATPESNPDNLATILSNMGYLHAVMGQPREAESAAFRSLTLLDGTAGSRETLWRSQRTLARTSRMQGQHADAILWGKEAVNTLQLLRADLNSLDKEVQSSYLQRKRHVYTELADLLIAEGRLPEAQTVLQMLKEHELHDDLQRAAANDPRSTAIALTGLERTRFAKYYELRDQQAALAAEREQLGREKRLGELSATQARRLDEIEKTLMPPLREAMQRFLAALQQEAGPRADSLGRSEADLRLAETNLQKVLQQALAGNPQGGAVALQYVVTDTRLSILISTAGAPPLARQFAVDAKALRGHVFSAVELLRRPDSDPDRLASHLRALHALLIAPVQADLKTLGAKTLVLVPNDVLRYVPFAALMSGERYLVQDYTLTQFNEAVKKDFRATPVATWHPAAMGLTRAVEDLPALPHVRDEVKAVAGTSGLAYLDDDFTRATLKRVLAQDHHTVLHLASHFVFEPGRPDASRFFLGDRSPLTLADIARDNLRFDHYALVAFSACETGVGGGHDATGREVESLGALVQNQGAQAVIATLWKVNDSSTAALMAHFYKGRAADKLDKAQALRQAQLAFIAGKAQGRARTHPYFWAPFVLMGDWR